MFNSVERPGAICSSCCEPTLLILGELYREDLVSDVEWVSRKNSRLTCHFETMSEKPRKTYRHQYGAHMCIQDRQRFG